MIDYGFERARKLPANRFARRRFAIDIAVRILAEAGVVDPPREEDSAVAVVSADRKLTFKPTYLGPNSRSASGDKWEDQISWLIKLGYHRARGISESEYRTLIPDFKKLPDEYATNFDQTLLVDPFLALREQMKILGIQNTSGKSLDEFPPCLGSDESPNPYQLWVQDGSKYLDVSVDQFNQAKAPFERGLNLIEGLALARENPRFNHGIHLAESVREVRGVRGIITINASLGRYRDGYAVRYTFTKADDSRFGVASCLETK